MTPLRRTLPLLLICSLLLVSITGCTSSSSNPAPSAAFTPAASETKSSAAADFDPILTKLAESLRSEYGDAVEQRRTNVDSDAVFVTFELNGRNTAVEIRNEGSVDAANRTFEALSACTSGDASRSSGATHFGQHATTDALGYAPTTVKDVYCTGTGEFAGIDNEYIQYDQLFIQTVVTTRA